MRLLAAGFATVSVLLLYGELYRLFFGERLNAVFSLPVGHPVEYLPEGLFAVFAEIASKSILYQLGFLAAFPARTLARTLDEHPVYPGFGSFHT